MVQTSNGLRATCRVTVPEPFLRFYVWLRSGEVHGYDLEERPEVKIGETVFTLHSAKHTVEYQADNILYFTLQDAAVNDPDGISLPEATSKMQFKEGELQLTGCTPNSVVSVYDMAGLLVQTTKTDANGNLSLSLNTLRSGIYIIKTNNTTFKIQKR